MRKSQLREVILVSLCVGVLYLFFSTTGIFDIPILKTTDLFFALTHKIKPLPSQINQITLVIIDDKTYDKIGLRWPWKRDVFALFLQKLKPYQPKFVCLDFAFVGEATPEEDRLLAEAIRETGNVFLPSYFSPSGEYIVPQKIFSEGSMAFGFGDKPRDKDSVIRRTSLVRVARTLKNELKILDYSVELKLMSKHQGIVFENIHLDEQHKRISLLAKDKEITIPLRENLTMLINYAAKQEEFHTIPFWKVMLGEANKEELKDRIVIVGETGEIFHDIHPTPLGLMPGMVVLANNLLMLLSGNFIQEFPPLGNFLVLALLGILAGIVTYRLPLLTALCAVGLEIIGVILVGVYLILRNWQWDFFSPIFVIVATSGTISLYEYLLLLKEAVNLRTLAITDGLTGLFVHRYFQLRLQYEFDRLSRFGGDLPLLIIDVDHFKNFNDTYGHESGNVALKAVAQVVRETCRKIDILARYGGEEFCVILPQSNLQGALIYAERLRKAIEKLEITLSNSRKTKITVSIGLASPLSSHARSPAELIEYADKALYEAKRQGRNRVLRYTTTSLLRPQQI